MKHIVNEFKNWDNWVAEIYSAIGRFEEAYGIVPSYVAANEDTFMQIDFLTNFSSLRNSVKVLGDNNPCKIGEVHITHIQYGNAVIDFVEDSSMANNLFSVEYDSGFDYNMATLPRQNVAFSENFGRVA